MIQNEREYLRKLAYRCRDIASLPIMEERKRRWKLHNSCKNDRPMVVMEMQTFEHELIPALRCETDLAKRIEHQLLRQMIRHEKIDDDAVMPDFFDVPMDIDIESFQIEKKRRYCYDKAGNQLGYADEHFIVDIEEDFLKLKNSEVRVNTKATMQYAEYASDVIGDILPIVIKNHSLEWFLGISQRIIELMGMEALMFAMYDSPETVKQLYRFVCDDTIGVLRRQEELGLLTANNGNDFAGAGSFGFADELKTDEKITTKMLWGNLNSQETVGVSPAMYGEFAFEEYRRLAQEFGLVYYGCCEPVHDLWEPYIRHIPGLRKVSVSPWCDEERMGTVLKGSNVIYSRKPSPNYIGVGRDLDEDAYTKHIEKTLRAATGCTLEIIHRDIYTLDGNPSKVKRAIELSRAAIERIW